jgi:GNAT superfamily N-acetyltransferase
MAETITITLNGTTDLPAGKIAAIVTSLEMRTAPPPRPDPPGSEGLALEAIAPADLDRYLRLYRLLGERWMWFSRLVMPHADLAAIRADDRTTAFALLKEGRDLGLLELDWREPGICELAFLGVAEELVGSGAGRFLMNRAIAMAWSRPITRLWVHTCTIDHHGAVEFYIRSGFTPFRRGVEVVDDPRLSGHMPLQAVPQCPVI